MSWSEDFLVDTPVARSKRVPAPDESDDIFDMEDNLHLDLLSTTNSGFLSLAADEVEIAGFVYGEGSGESSYTPPRPRGRPSSNRQSRRARNGVSDRERIEREQQQKERFLRECGATRCPERHAAGSVPELYWTEV